MSWSAPDDSTAANRQTWQRFSEAWARRDIDGLMALVTDDIVDGASVGPEPGTTSRGRDEVRRGFEHMLRHDQDACLYVSRQGILLWAKSFAGLRVWYEEDRRH
jgi:ketosteroid isomerase-like protein